MLSDDHRPSEDPSDPESAGASDSLGDSHTSEALDLSVDGTLSSDEARGGTADGDAPPVEWESLDVPDDRITVLRALGFERPMEVQTETFDLIRNGRDLVVQSRTGSGKTVAFSLPLITKIAAAGDTGARVLALAPTRELAIQVADETARVAQGTPVMVTAVYGGAALGPQIQRLEQGTQFVCGTPGRVLDHIRRRTLRVASIETLVLDEADEMLSMGFYEELSAIINALPNRKQTLLFSATIPGEVQRLANKYLHDPERLLLSEDFVGVKEIQHVYYLVSGMARPRDMLRVLQTEAPGSAIIFCNTREETSHLSRYLRDAGFRAEAISSDLTQVERERAMQNLRERRTQFLVATDVAARGIDVADLSHVFNYRFPDNADIYIHRTGRTGRAGRSGVAVSLVSPQELGDFYYMKLTHEISPEERFLPTTAELASRMEGERFAALATQIDENDAAVEPEFLGLARRVWHSLRGEEIVALLLEEHFARPPRESQGAPLRSRERRDDDSRGDIDGDTRNAGGPSREERPRESRADTHRLDGPDGRGGMRRDSERSRRPSGDRDAARRRDSDSRGSSRPEEEGTKLYLNLGHKEGVKPSTLIQFLVDNAGMDRKDVYRIQIRDGYSFVSVAPGVAEDAVAKANGSLLGDKTVAVEIARPR